MFEVEQKFRIDDLPALETRLAELHARPGETVEQCDHYFNHPARDFAQSDKALRLRQVGQLNFITYKGPKLDAATKTRREIELPLPDGEKTSAGFAEILTALGFRAVAEVRKTRRQSHVYWEGREVEIAMDDVAGVGQYVELELMAAEAELESAKATILSLANRLQLGTSERRSYLELLLSNQNTFPK